MGQASLSITSPAGLALGPTESCDMATKGFLTSVCATGEVTHQNETDGECTKHNRTTSTTEVDRLHCDAKAKMKYMSYHTTTKHSSPYPDGKDCGFALNAWKDGEDRSHKGACGNKVIEIQIV